MGDDHKRQSSDDYTLSRSLERMLLQDNSDQASKAQWGTVALRNMALILREYGFEVKEPASFEKDCEPESQKSWSNAEPGGQITPPQSDPLTDEVDTFARFRILTNIMDSKRGEDGRVDAISLQEALLKADSKIFEKEGVDQLRQYLMKAREGGIPIKFDGDRSGLHQVWFKGHKDLEVALARYSQPGQNRRPPPPPFPCTSRSGPNDWSWRNRTSQPQGGRQFPTSTFDNLSSRATNEVASRYRAPSDRAFDVDYLLDLLQSSGANSEQGADAKYIEQKLLEVTQSLYDVRPDVKRFSHYLMNMRAAGAPIWFSRDENDNQPKEIFIKHTNSSLGPIRFPVPQTNWSGLQQSPNSEQQQQQQQHHHSVRFAALIEAYQFHLQSPDYHLADGQLVQSRLEAMDPNAYSREQCSSFKHFLKIAKTSGLDVNWEQNELGITTISIRL